MISDAVFHILFVKACCYVGDVKAESLPPRRRLPGLTSKKTPSTVITSMFKPLMEKRRRDSKSELSSEYTSTLARYDQVSKANVKA
jgi:hypothetical protein